MPAKDIYHNGKYRRGEDYSMDKLTKYRQIIRSILTEYYQWAANSETSEIKECLSFDEEREHYLWFHVGGNEKKRIFSVIVYIRIQKNKIWLEEDWTKQGIVNDLLDKGIPKEDIVLGFQHPKKRHLTEFAIQ